jgi:FG-GAP-like repeat/Putative Ig domain
MFQFAAYFRESVAFFFSGHRSKPVGEHSATLTNDASQQGVSWSLTGPGSLGSSNTSAVTYISPTTSLTSAQQVIVTATSIADHTKSASLQITVNPYPQISLLLTLPNGTVGTPYSQTIVLTGGTAPFQWSIYNGPIITGWKVGGTVPDGLTLNPSTGGISGTPTSAGTWYFEAAVTDAVNVAVVDGFLSIEIEPSGPRGNPVPFLNQPLVPTAVSPASAGFTLSVSGAGFMPAATVDFNRVPLTTAFVDTEHLTATVPAANVANAGTIAVTVVNPAPGGGSSNVVYFQVASPETSVSFANAANSPLQIPEPNGIAIGDFNEDGKPDLAIAAGTRMYFFLGNGDGTFAAAANSPMLVPSPPYNDFGSPYTGPLAVGDFNHSGHLGLAVGEFQSAAGVIFLGKGNGTFAFSSANFVNAIDLSVSAVQAADFNGDGYLDLALADGIYGVAPVALGYGDGAFNTAGDLVNSTGEGFPNGVGVGDFNGDGRLDAAIANGGSTKIPYSGLDISLGNGDGTFTLANGSPMPLGQDLWAIATADFNGDGKLDVAVTDFSGATVMILLGNGDGTFGPPTTIPVGNGPASIVAGDFNNDGKLDLAIANEGDGTVTLLLGNGDGTFSQASGSPYAVGPNPVQIVAGDFNGDGKLDLAVILGTAANNAGSVAILLQQ